MTSPSDGTPHGDAIEALQQGGQDRQDTLDAHTGQIGDLQSHEDGSAAAVEALRQELAATNVLLVALSRELQADRVETTVRVEGLRAEQHRERRIRMMAVVGGGVTVINAYDQHIEHCSPGARVVKGVDWLLTHPGKPGEDPIARQTGFEKAYDHASVWCDVTLPLHTHDGHAWPTPADGVGMVLMGLAVVSTFIYHRLRTIRDYRRVSEAVAREEEHVRR